MFLKENLDKILLEIKDGNNLKEKIMLIGATKTMDTDTINLAIQNGLEVVAENKVQEFREKTDKIKGASQHFIGHLQTNKVKYLVGKVDLIHSVDSIKLALEISRQAVKVGVTQDILLEVNVGGELSKSGICPDTALEFYNQVKNLDGLKVKGLMAMLPKTDDQQLLKSLVLKMREIYDIIKEKDTNIEYLSVGMSADYQVAIKNGANVISIGSLIFGKRNYGDNQNGNI
ncbi:MAG: YggS family pyridoxal phosphate-dependent enzyme [Clostridia bacterium]|nr:YggS family pyridoxal phosphate-dependent enzyme [Clostridia bacterium]